MNNNDNSEKWYFSDNEKDSKKLTELVVEGIKTATTSIYNGTKLEIGNRTILTDFYGKEIAILELTDYKILPFNEITIEMAEKEGEGNKSLEYWRDVHRRFFAKRLNCTIEDFDETIIILYEEFKIVKRF